MPTRPPVHRPAGVPPAEVQRRAYERHRGSAASRGYDRAWRRLREVVLAEEPLCRFCLQGGLVTAATDVDHIQTVERRPDLRLVRSNLRPLCHPCHSSRTASEQPGGRAAPSGQVP